MFNKNLKVVLLIFIFLFLPIIAQAAKLSFDPSEGEFGPGDNFALNLKININSGCVNTVDADIIFPKDSLQIIDFLTGNSIINIWIKQPSKNDIKKANQTGHLHFSGGIPGGYCGRIPGDPGVSNVIGKIIFAVPSLAINNNINIAKVFLGKNTKILLNDGLGTADKIEIEPAKIKILNKSINPKINWPQNIKKDSTPPEPFTIELHRSERMFNNKYYIIFSTTDKQTGVDHYEVLELKPGENIGIHPKLTWKDRLLGIKRKSPNWQIAKMPYVLEDQSLSSVIKVKAVDKAGNERMVEYIPPLQVKKVNKSFHPFLIMVSLIGGGVFIIILIILLILKFIKKNKKYENKED